jgi:FkbH-like protein
MKTFSDLKKNLKLDPSNLKPLRLALLGDSSTQFLNIALRGEAVDLGFHLQLWEADFDQIELQAFDPNSELYRHQPEIVVLFFATHKLLNNYNKKNSEQQAFFAENHLAKLKEVVSVIQENANAKIICYNQPEIDDTVFGNFSNSVPSSFLYQLRKINLELMNFAENIGNFYVCDLSSVQNRVGRNTMFQPSIYINTEMVLSIEVLPEIAARTMSLVAALNGKLKKCLILDLDNTMWGGIIGDDGIENIQVGSLGIGKAFTELQHWAKKLKNRGVILCVCSKNTEHIAKEPFEKHPDMVLRLDDIAVFVANWENKADNIIHIQQVLNIGFDSMVFLDDNPFERNLVRENIPGITVPELPEDPAEYLEYLYCLNLFETVSFSGNDSERTKQYQVEAQRMAVQKSFVNEDDFLQSLQMTSVVQDFSKFNTPRVSQLSQRSNQFNLRTVRYTEGDIEAIGKSDTYKTFSFTLEDKFGDNGLISAIILKKENCNIMHNLPWEMY